ncbi:TRAP transporter substrate-binding protein DctP [Chloroflexota bacterium]
MRKIGKGGLQICLALILAITGVLASFSVATGETLNQVDVSFQTRYQYPTTSDNFDNALVTGNKRWGVPCRNIPDTGLPADIGLILDSNETLDQFNPEPTTSGPKHYEWDFINVAENTSFGASMGYSDPPEVTYTPGFDLSRSFDETIFNNVGTQTISVNVTPRREMNGTLFISVRAPEDENVSTTIISPVPGTPDYSWGEDGRRIQMRINEPQEDIPYTFEVTIKITPEVPEVEFKAGATAFWMEPIVLHTTTTNDSIPHNMPEIGDWTINAVGDYEVGWKEQLMRQVELDNYSEEIVETGTISGTVYEADGQTPIANVRVHPDDFNTGQRMERIHTDTNGNYTVSGLPVGSYRVYTHAYDTGLNYVDEWYNEKSSGDQADPVEVTTGVNTPGIDFTLEPGGTISGHVSDDTGPIEDANISVYDFESLSGSWVSYGGTRTDADGNYTTVGLPAGEYGVRVRADGYATEWYQDTYFRDVATSVTVNTGVETGDVNFSLEPGGTISGYVSDGTGPIEDANISVFDYESLSDSWVYYGGNRTDADGEYRTDGIPAGVYGVRVRAAGYATNKWYDNTYSKDEADPVSVTASEDTSGINFVLDALERRGTTEEAIADGIAWLATQQNEDGSWGAEYPLAKTGLAVLKLNSHATDLGFSSPFYPEYLYIAEAQAGLNYIFSNAYTTSIGTQPAGNPDLDGDTIGVYFRSPEYPEGQERVVYETSIAMMAIAASTAPDRVVEVDGSQVNGWTYKDVLRDAVDYMAWAQTDTGYGRGGWNYGPMDNVGSRSDGSISGWATLGLAHAQAPPPIGFSLPVPGFVKRELDVWIDYIQNDVDGDPEDGGADYSGPDSTHELWVNMLKTGHLLQQMAFVGDTEGKQRVEDAIEYLVRQWGENYDPGWRGNPNCYHTTYTVMKGLEAFGIATIDGIDWFGEFDDALRNEQAGSGWWLSSRWDDGDRILSTEWALLTLQKVKALPPPPPLPVADAGGPYLVELGVPVTLDGSAAPGREIVDWYWTFGDGNNDSGDTVSHTYDTVGLYVAELTVTNDVGGHDTDSTMVVVYDPSAGFATGGGWFTPGGQTSDEGDFLPEIDGTSPANFGFVVKYKKGATSPDGQLEFQYQQGDFNLHSTGMDWLVVTNNNWAKFQGIATIKGFEGFYPFHVDARDGDFGGGTEPDRFIIKVYAPVEVWPPEEDPDLADPIYKASGDLEGGNIVIHKKVTTLRLQSGWSPESPLWAPLENFVQVVEEHSGGSVRIKLYERDALVPNNQLAEAVKSGEVEMGLISTGWLRDYSRVMDAGSLPFLYNDHDGLTAAMQAGIGDLMTEDLKAHNITAIDWTTTAFFHLFSNGMMLDDPEDVADLKIRTFGRGLYAEAIETWLGTPVFMPITNMYNAFSDGTIDGAVSSLGAYDGYTLYEVAPYLCVDYAFAYLAALSVNSDVWSSMKANERKIITEAANDYVIEMLMTGKQMDEEDLDRIEGYAGVEVYTLSPTERAVWRQASEQVWNDWISVVGAVGQEIIDIALAENPLP